MAGLFGEQKSKLTILNPEMHKINSYIPKSYL